MIGLGCGARSYTQRIHYATRFAVTQSGVRAILREWIGQSNHDFANATHGLCLSEEEQIRRYVILSLLQMEGMSLREFAQRFPGVDVDSLTGLPELRERGWLRRTEEREVLTALGLEHSDQVGPMLYSATVRDRLREFTVGPNR
jgi:coproporphyrinogen III oxidase-like Fe-S oxidoreductase